VRKSRRTGCQREHDQHSARGAGRRRDRPVPGWVPGWGYGGSRHLPDGEGNQFQEDEMPGKSANVKNEKQYEALKDKGMSKERAAKIANAPKSSEHGGEQSGTGGDSKQGGTTAQKKKAGHKGGKAAARKS
jgi:hypothetical protein